jgi:hypothetical protein
MIDKSALRKTIKEQLEEHEVEGRDVLEDVVDALCLEFPDEIHDDEDEESEDDAPDFLGE